MIKLGAAEDECADLLICVLCGAPVCTVTAIQNGGSRAPYLGTAATIRDASHVPAGAVTASIRRLFPDRSPRQSSANAARGGLRPPLEGRSRGATKSSSSAQHDKKITYL